MFWLKYCYHHTCMVVEIVVADPRAPQSSQMEPSSTSIQVPVSWGDNGTAATAGGTAGATPRRTNSPTFVPALTVYGLKDQLTVEFQKVYEAPGLHGDSIQILQEQVGEVRARVVDGEIQAATMLKTAEMITVQAQSAFEEHRGAIGVVAQGAMTELDKLKTELGETQVQAKAAFDYQRLQFETLQEQAKNAFTQLEAKCLQLQQHSQATEAAVHAATAPQNKGEDVLSGAGDPWAKTATFSAAAGLNPPGLGNTMDSEGKPVNTDTKVLMQISKLKSECPLPEYHSWKRLARSALTVGRPEVGKLLAWAKQQEDRVDRGREGEARAAIGVNLDIG